MTLARVKYQRTYSRKEVDALLTHVMHKTAREFLDMKFEFPKTEEERVTNGALTHLLMYGEVSIMQQPKCGWDYSMFGNSAGALTLRRYKYNANH